MIICCSKQNVARIVERIASEMYWSSNRFKSCAKRCISQYKGNLIERTFPAVKGEKRGQYFPHRAARTMASCHGSHAIKEMALRIRQIYSQSFRAFALGKRNCRLLFFLFQSNSFTFYFAALHIYEFYKQLTKGSVGAS